MAVFGRSVLTGGFQRIYGCISTPSDNLTDLGTHINS